LIHFIETEAIGIVNMDERPVIDFLEELHEGFDVQIRHETIRQDEDSVFVSGGLCLFRGKYVRIGNSSA